MTLSELYEKLTKLILADKGQFEVFIDDEELTSVEAVDGSQEVWLS